MTKLIEGIAYQCLKEGGKVVYRARALYQLTENRLFEDDCSSIQALQSSMPDGVSFDTAASINSMSKDQELGQIKVYPNPTKQFLQIQLPEILSEQQLNIALYTMQGQQIQTWPSSHTENQRLDIKNIPAGIYWLNISSEEEIILNRRVVVLP